MKRLLLVLCVAALAAQPGPVRADSRDKSETGVSAETVGNAVRVTLLKAGGDFVVQSVSGASSARTGCQWSVVFAPELSDVPYGTSPGPMPDPDARFALLLCDGVVVRSIWVAPADIVDVDALAQAQVERYVREVLTPAVSIGVNPSTKGLAGLRSWYWIDGFSGSVTAPPISAFGLSVEVRMSTRWVTWDFGDGTVERGDLGRAYPAESTVQHAHRDAGTYRITATITLAPEYRINGGAWLTLPDLTASASRAQQVEQRQPVVTDT